MTPCRFGSERMGRLKTACWLPGQHVSGVDQIHAGSVEQWLRQRCGSVAMTLQ